MASNGHIHDGRFGLKSWLLVVLALFIVIMAIVAGLALFGADDGMLPFDYEGF